MIRPVLALHGDRDDYGSIAFPQFIIDQITGSDKMVILKDCAHAPHKEQKLALIEQVVDFFEDHIDLVQKR